MNATSCVLCDFSLESVKFSLQEQTTTSSFTILLHVLQYAVGVEVILNDYYVCSSCYNLLDLLERIELKANEIKQRLSELYWNYRKKHDESENKTEVAELPLQDISDSLIKEESDDNKRIIEKTAENSKQEETASSKGDYQCSLCDKRFVYKRRYDSHQRKFHSNPNENIIEPTEKCVGKTPQGFQDNFATENAEEEELFNEDKHASSENHSTEDKRKKSNGCKQPSGSAQGYQCLHCPKLWKTYSRLKAHLSAHSDGKAFVCEVCGQSYKHKTALDVHLGMHNGINPYTCTYCHKSFTQKGGLVRHLAIHTGEKHHQCDLCGKRFVHHTSFNIHKLSHTGKKDYKCEVCGLALMSGSHLKRHMRVHTGEKKHSCSTCGKSFAERYNLVSHEKLHRSAASAPQGRTYRCHICNVGYDERLQLEEHLANDHDSDVQQIQTSWMKEIS